MTLRRFLFALLVIGQWAGCVRAQVPESGRLLATSGVTQVEGAGGGGLVPWAVITGYGTNAAVGANVHNTTIVLPSFRLDSVGVATGLYDRLELSYAHIWFDTQESGAHLGIGRGFTINQDVAGVKLRLIGDAIYDQDRWLPQIAAGLQFKSNDAHSVLEAVGARGHQGVDLYLAATKLFLAQSLLSDITMRMTKANQFGLLGFGGDADNSYTPEFEGSLAYLLTKRAAIGAELRTKPNNLKFAQEETAYDIFAAYFFSKNLSATLAYVDLGAIARQGQQSGAYVSLQVGF